MARHSRDEGPRRPNAAVGLVALLVLLLAGVGVFFFLRGDDAPEDPVAGPDEDRATETTEPEPTPTEDAVATTDPGDCTPVSVWVAAEVLEAVSQAAERATSDCYTFEVQEREGAAALTALGDGEAPDVWVPGSTAWAHLAGEDGVDLEIGETLASSPVLLFTTPESAEALAQLGVTADSTLADLTGTYRELAAAGDSPVLLRVGDPRVDPASMTLLAGTREQPGGWADDSDTSREILVRLAQATVPGDPLTAVQSDPRAVVPATEQQAAQAQEEGLTLQGVALAGGESAVQVPFVRLGGGGSADAVQALEQELLSEEGAADLTGLGLRPGTDGPAPGVAGVPEDLEVPDTAPSAQAVVQTAETWAAVAPESRILAVVDISGSMQAEIDGTTRIDLARTALQTAISAIPEQTALGLWYFSTALDGDVDHAEQVPLRPLGEQVDGQTQREDLLAVTDDLGLQTLGGDTGLHDTLWAGYQEMLAQQGPDSIASILLLTDGVDDDSTGGLSEDEVVGLLTQAREASEIPVSVVLLGMGPDVDEAALQRLADAAGGEFVLISDALELPQVFVDVVADRAP